MMAKLKLMFLIPLFLSSSLLSSVSKAVALPYQAYPLTKSNNCPGKCGDIDIPFPFGIGSDCFLDDWYEILCNNSIPQLKKLNLQVLNISFPRDIISDDPTTVTVNYPVSYSNSSCTPSHHGSHESVNFHGSPFFISRTYNIFVAVGCENFAILKGSNHSFVGCSTECTGNYTRRYSPCDGLDCCHSTFPDSLQGFGVDFQGAKIPGTSGVDRGCQFAFLASSSWFEPNSTDLYAIRDGGYVPVVLRWGIVDAAFPTSIGLEPLNRTYSADINYYTHSTYINNYYYYYSHYCEQYYPYSSIVLKLGIYYESGNARCDNVNINMNTTAPFINCNCHRGLYGNPYLKDGCKDVNECEIPLSDGSMPCGGLRHCKNERGYFFCRSKTDIRPLLSTIGLYQTPGAGLFLLICLPWCTWRRIKKRREAKRKAKFFKRISLAWQLSSPEGNGEKGRLFNSKELEKATDHFNENRVLGKGGQGTVYKGMLIDGRIVAVKKSIALDEENVEPIINELVILSQINHRNVVKLLGCCLARDVPLLVYEFIPNGTLYQYLHDQQLLISWETRLRISTEIAGAIFYLHSSASIPIYHRDIKSSNILLDENYRAKIADFGTSRSVALDQTHLTTLVQGTFGYLDPEYFQSSQFTNKSDVYSFGVVLVELLTGQKPVCSLRASEGRNLAAYFIISVAENHLFDILDATVLDQGRAEEITAVANLAKRCLNPKGRGRPTMREVVMELEGIQDPALRSSRMEENQETKRDHMEAETLVGVDATFATRGTEMETNVISFSHAHPFLPSKTW